MHESVEFPLFESPRLPAGVYRVDTWRAFESNPQVTTGRGLNVRLMQMIIRHNGQGAKEPNGFQTTKCSQREKRKQKL